MSLGLPSTRFRTSGRGLGNLCCSPWDPGSGSAILANTCRSVAHKTRIRCRNERSIDAHMGNNLR